MSASDLTTMPATQARTNPRCSGCDGPHPFDTSIPSVVWDRVIRENGYLDYLCATCILRAFVRHQASFTAQLSGDGFHNVSIEVRVNGEVAQDAALIQDENNALRWKLREAEAQLAALTAERDALKATLAEQQRQAKQESDFMNELESEYGDVRDGWHANVHWKARAEAAEAARDTLLEDLRKFSTALKYVQHDLPADAAKILRENLWSLYV